MATRRMPSSSQGAAPPDSQGAAPPDSPGAVPPDSQAAGSPGSLGAGSPAAFSQSLERGLLILSSFSESRPVLGIADIARSVELNKSTTYRYVATLAKLGYVQQDPETKK